MIIDFELEYYNRNGENIVDVADADAFERRLQELQISYVRNSGYFPNDVNFTKPIWLIMKDKVSIGYALSESEAKDNVFELTQEAERAAKNTHAKIQALYPANLVADATELYATESDSTYCIRTQWKAIDAFSAKWKDAKVIHGLCVIADGGWRLLVENTYSYTQVSKL